MSGQLPELTSDLEDLLHEVVSALDQEKYYILINDGKKTIVVKNIPTEDLMSDLDKQIWQIPS